MCRPQEWHLQPDKTLWLKTNHGAPDFLDSGTLSCCLSSAQVRLLWCCLWLTAGLWQLYFCFSIKSCAALCYFSIFFNHIFPSLHLSMKVLGTQLRAAASSTVNFGIEPSLFRMSLVVFWITHRSEVLYMMLESPEPDWSHLKARRTFAAVWAH